MEKKSPRGRHRELRFTEADRAAIGMRFRQHIDLNPRWDTNKLAREMNVSRQQINNMCDGHGSLAAFAIACRTIKASLDYVILGKDPFEELFREFPELKPLVAALKSRAPTPSQEVQNA